MKPFSLLVEVLCFSLITVFCLGAWVTRPIKIYSLRDTMDSNQASSSPIRWINPPEAVTITLPLEMQAHFQREHLSALRLAKDGETVTSMEWRLDWDQTQNTSIPKSTGLFFYTVGVNQRPTQIEMRLSAASQTIRKRSPLIPAGGSIWRDRIAMLENPGAPQSLFLVPVNTNGKSFLCDVGFFRAPGLPFWALEGNP
ncbi:MAG: hypothetical protein RBU29_17080 [bacterium]|jgi:hypothetical protein|nr:hypothetical protein [bacterium]